MLPSAGQKLLSFGVRCFSPLARRCCFAALGEQRRCKGRLWQSILSSPRFSCPAQGSAFYQGFQIAAGCRLRNTGEFAVHGIGNHTMLPNVAHCLLHALLLLEYQGLIGGDIQPLRLRFP